MRLDLRTSLQAHRLLGHLLNVHATLGWTLQKIAQDHKLQPLHSRALWPLEVWAVGSETFLPRSLKSPLNFP